ncbi:porin family protein [Algibacter pacificus]|uniref:porin family protein n=1 Tax=Algibacter pacificus TaxID=2599389 RepID=UPI0011CBB1CC|nr:porin family protein [Algibacter pacificus]
MSSIKYIIALLVLFQTPICFSQEGQTPIIDKHYKEDQFYIGVTYNLLNRTPSHLNQTGFSPGIHFGFIKDMPVNKARNVAIGLGLGLSSNTYNQNVFIDVNNTNSFNYSLITDSNTFSKNKFSTHFVEIPLEFRWRTSTATSYEFWRIYAGFKFSYLLAHNTKYKGDLGSFKHSNISDFNNFQYGLSLSAGYNTWNIHFYYALNPIFSKAAKLDGKTINFNAIKIGLMFYIL